MRTAMPDDALFETACPKHHPEHHAKTSRHNSGPAMGSQPAGCDRQSSPASKRPEASPVPGDAATAAENVSRGPVRSSHGLSPATQCCLSSTDQGMKRSGSGLCPVSFNCLWPYTPWILRTMLGQTCDARALRGPPPWGIPPHTGGSCFAATFRRCRQIYRHL
jgi:hypothetical protein